MPKKTKRQEAAEDLKRYYKLLPELEEYNDREFFMDGIIQLDRTFRGELHSRFTFPEEMWKVFIMVKESPYTPEAIAQAACIEPEEVRDFLDGNFPDIKLIKRIYLSMEYYGVK